MEGRPSSPPPRGPASGFPARPLAGAPPAERRGPGATLALLALPILCCGGPAIIGALGAASAATLGVVGAVIGGILMAVAIVLWVRHRHRRAACCPPTRGAVQP